MNIILEVTVPEAWQTKVLDSFNAIVNKDIALTVRLNSWKFRIDPKQSGETNKQFGERVLRELGKAVVNLVDKAEDEIRYENEMNAISPPESDVPSDVLT